MPTEEKKNPAAAGTTASAIAPAAAGMQALKRFGMARDTPANHQGSRPHSNSQACKCSGLHGPCGPYPATFRDCNEIKKVEGNRAIKLSSCHPLTVVSRRERGKAALPAEGYSRRFHPILTAEPQCRSGALKRSQFNACQFMGVIPPLSGLTCSEGL